MLNLPSNRIYMVLDWAKVYLWPPTKVKRRVPPAGVVVDVGDAEGLDGNGADAQQQLAQQQQRVDGPLGVAVLLLTRLVGGQGGEAEAGLVTAGCCRKTGRLSLKQQSKPQSQEVTFRSSLDERSEVRARFLLVILSV